MAKDRATNADSTQMTAVLRMSLECSTNVTYAASCLGSGNASVSFI